MLRNLHRLSENELAAVQSFLDDLISSRFDGEFPGLTAQELRFVRALRAARGRVLSHETLAYQCAYDPCSATTTGVIKAVACKVRAKSDIVRRCLGTAWGHGYYWKEPAT